MSPVRKKITRVQVEIEETKDPVSGEKIRVYRTITISPPSPNTVAKMDNGGKFEERVRPGGLSSPGLSPRSIRRSSTSSGSQSSLARVGLFIFLVLPNRLH